VKDFVKASILLLELGTFMSQNFEKEKPSKFLLMNKSGEELEHWLIKTQQSISKLS